MKRRAFIFFFACVLSAASRAPATVFRMLTGDYTTINADWSAYENGNNYATVESGSPFQPLIATQHYAGNYSIQIQVPTDNTGNKERFEYRVAAATDPDGLHFDNARYSGFAFRVASPTAAFQSSALIWQAWQGSPWGPPASFKILSSSSAPFTAALYIRNLITGPDSAVPDVKLWSSAMIQPDTWYAVVIYIAPRFTNNNGNIRLWINGTNYANCTTNIGYDPSQTYSLNGTNYGVLNGLDLKNGIYQPDANNGHTLFFDQIICADTFAEAAGSPPPTNTPPTAASGSATILRSSFSDFDLATLCSDAQTPAPQCLYTLVTATNGTVSLLADGHTAHFVPTTNFTGGAGYGYVVTDNGEDPREFLHYRFEPPDAETNGYVTDNSGQFRDGRLLAVGTGAFGLGTNTPFPIYSSNSLQLTQSGSSGAACLQRYISNPAELNLSDSSWTFSGWFQRTATTDHDFIFYLGSGDGFGGNGDELQFYCPGGSATLAVQHYNTSNVLDLNATSGATATTGQWHHAALVFQRTNSSTGILRAYLDGAQFAATNVTWSLQQTPPVVFGGHNLTNSNINRWFSGRLDDLVLFTNALSATEVARLATRTAAQFGGFSATNFVTVTVTNYSRPTLTAMALTNGIWTMWVNGDSGANYTVQTSTNLVNWTGLLTTNPPVLPFRFMDSPPGGINRRFYRVFIGP